jgi:hypothetical protein
MWWAWVVIGWCMASVCIALGLARWFRFLREQDDRERWGIW